MITWVVVALVVLVFATARVTRAVTIDKIGEPLRKYVERRFTASSLADYYVNCYWCVAVWVAAALSIAPIIYIVHYVHKPWWFGVCAWLYVSASVSYPASWLIDKERIG